MFKMIVCTVIFMAAFAAIVNAGETASAKTAKSETIIEKKDLVKDARQLFRNGEDRAAFDTATKAVEEKPGNWIAHYYVARSADRLGMSEKAVDAYEKCLRLKPGYYYTLNNLGYLYLKSGKYEKARKLLEEAVESSIAEAYSWRNLAETYRFLGEKEKYAEALEKAGMSMEIIEVKKTSEGKKEVALTGADGS